MIQSILLLTTVLSLYGLICYFFSKNIIFKRTKGNFTYIDAKETFDFIKYELDPRGFEVFAAELFKEMGYNAHVTQASQDWGRDVVVDDGKILIECKQYRNAEVGRDILFKFYGAIVYHDAETGIIINTGNYNSPAQKVGEKLSDKIQLWDSIKLMEIFHSLGKERVEDIINRTLAQQNISLRIVKDDDEIIEEENKVTEIGDFLED